MENYNYLSIEEANGILKIGLNRAQKRNALNGELVEQLSNILQQSADNSHIKIIILYGKGEHFCAGADIAWMQKISHDTKENNLQDAKKLSHLFYQLYHFPKPIITAVHGITLGGGLGLIAASDIVLASRAANFEFSEIKLDLIPFVISPYIIAAIGERTARYYFLTGKRFDSETAKQIGLIHEIIDEDICKEADHLAHNLLNYSSATLNATKKWIQEIKSKSINLSLADLTAEQLAHLRSSSHTQTKLEYFLNKKI
jgi:methylglutaconyl-CoA hydratase